MVPHASPPGVPPEPWKNPCNQLQPQQRRQCNSNSTLDSHPRVMEPPHPPTASESNLCSNRPSQRPVPNVTTSLITTQATHPKWLPLDNQCQQQPLPAYDHSKRQRLHHYNPQCNRPPAAMESSHGYSLSTDDTTKTTSTSTPSNNFSREHGQDSNTAIDNKHCQFTQPFCGHTVATHQCSHH